MLNYLWGGMILIGVLYGTIQGKLAEVTAAALSSAQEAITLCITMAGVMALWVGIMEVAERAGILEAATRKIRPFIQFLFPRIPKQHPARKYITMNIIANVFGLGWAATPAGLKAMEELDKLEEERRTPGYKESRVASNEMCNFLILNISSLQLIPINMIAYRSQYGSVNPAVIVGPAILATTVSTVAGIVFCKIMDRRKKNPG
ncbi:MAG: nucleoside recognition protein [Lachnospiraceae bacterium]|nr:nucleoside recognition protein [Lachnospiraceae bacterium]